MARTNREGTLGTPMLRAEIIGGFLYFAVYLLLLPWLLRLLPELLGFPLSDLARRTVFFAVNFVAVVLIFRRWLMASFQTVVRRFWDVLQAAVLGFAFYYALQWFLTWLYRLLKLTAANPNNESILTMAGQSLPLTLVCVVLLAPPVEETLFRGLIFANLREKSRILAYAASALVFAAAHIWQYAGAAGWTATLLGALQYLPAGIALGWTFEKADTVWAPILVHAFLNAVAMGVF